MVERLSYQDLKSLLLVGLRRSAVELAVLIVLMSSVGITLVVTRDAVFKTSWTLLLPSTERSTTVNLDNIGEARTTTRNAYGNVSLSPKHTYREIALSQAVLGKAAERFGVPIYAFTKPKMQLVQQTPAIRFTLKGTDPEKLKRRAQVFNQAFHDTLDELRANEIERQDRGIQKQLQKAKTRLMESQTRIVEFKTQTLLISDEQLPLKIQTLENLRAQSIEGMVELAKLQAALEETSRLLGVDADQATALMGIISMPQTAALVKQYGELNAEATVLAATVGPEYPTRMLLEKKCDALREKLLAAKASEPQLSILSQRKFLSFLSSEHVETLAELAQNRVVLESTMAQQAQYEQSLESLNEGMRNFAKDVAKLDALERDFQIAEAIFSSALTRLDSGKFDIYATYPLTQLLTEPGMTLTRDHLITKLIIVALVLMTGLLGLMIFLYEVRKHFVQEWGAS